MKPKFIPLRRGHTLSLNSGNSIKDFNIKDSGPLVSEWTRLIRNDYQNSVQPVYGEGGLLLEAVVKVNAKRIDLMSGVDEVIDDEVAVDGSVKLESRGVPRALGLKI